MKKLSKGLLSLFIALSLFSSVGISAVNADGPNGDDSYDNYGYDYYYYSNDWEFSNFLWNGYCSWSGNC